MVCVCVCITGKVEGEKRSIINRSGYRIEYNTDRKIKRGKAKKREERKTNPTRRPRSHLSGQKSSASGPKMSLRLCIWCRDHLTGVPLGTRIGCFPSGPPPHGRIVSLFDSREFVGTGGNSRRPKFGLYVLVDVLFLFVWKGFFFGR